MNKMSRLRIAEREHLDKIHEATLAVLEKTGIIFEHPEAVAVFKDHGAEVDGKLVRIPASLVEKAIESAPASFTLTARNEEKSVLIGEGQTRPHVEPNHGPVFIQSQDEGRRLGTIDDLANIYRLCHASEVCDIVGSIPVDPSGLNLKERRPRIFYELLNSTDKAIRFVVGTAEEVAKDFEMLECARGRKGWLDDVHAIYFSMNPLSPLCYDRTPLETIMAYARRNQPVAVLTCALNGVSSPLGLTGSAVMQNAEILAGLVLTQIITPGLPFLYGPASARPNLRTGAYITGSPESNMMNIVNFQLALEKYHLPIRAMSGMTDSKSIDMQAGYETMQNIMMCLLGGAHVINETMGVLDCIMTTSYEKFIIDQELIARVFRMMEPLNDLDADLSVAEIDKVGPRGSYLMRPTTLKNCRKVYTPTVSYQESYDTWKSSGCPDIIIRAAEKYRSILDAAPKSMLTDDLAKQLQTFIK